MMADFSPTREDGRSDRRVIFDLAKESQPGTVFTHEELIDALSEGLSQRVRKDRVYRAITSGNKALLRGKGRYLQSLQGRGYRVIHTNEAIVVAKDRQKRAEVNLKGATDVLRETWQNAGELTPVERALHEATFLILSQHQEALKQSARRHDSAEAKIADLLGRVERLEKKD